VILPFGEKQGTAARLSGFLKTAFFAFYGLTFYGGGGDNTNVG
jgi:hypothetical protein